MVLWKGRDLVKATEERGIERVRVLVRKDMLRLRDTCDIDWFQRWRVGRSNVLAEDFTPGGPRLSTTSLRNGAATVILIASVSENIPSHCPESRFPQQIW